MPAAATSHRHDHLRRRSWRAASGADGRLRDGATPAAGDRADWRAARQSGPDHVHHTSALSAGGAIVAGETW